MKSHYIIIGAALVLIAIFFGFAVVQDDQLTGERARNAELEKKVESLEQQVSALKDTDESYFQKGVDMQYDGNLEGAKDAFEAVIPSSRKAIWRRRPKSGSSSSTMRSQKKEAQAKGAKGKTDAGKQ